MTHNYSELDGKQKKVYKNAAMKQKEKKGYVISDDCVAGEERFLNIIIFKTGGLRYASSVYAEVHMYCRGKKKKKELVD